MSEGGERRLQEERGESWRREKSAGQERRFWEESAEKERIVQDKFILIVPQG